MDNKLLLAKSLSLLYWESLLQDRTENSSDLVKTVLETIQISEVGLGINTEREVVQALKTTIIEMCNNPLDHEYDTFELLQRLKINTGYDEKYVETLKQSIDDKPSEASLKRRILNTRKSINNHFKEQKINEILNKASYAVKYQREKISNMDTFLSELIGQLEPLQMNTSGNDPAVVDDIDIGNDESMKEAFQKIQNNNNGGRVYRTGWKRLDRMLQGGIRPGEFVAIPALQHKYKTGLTLSLFKQIALYNTPITTPPGKKPLLLRISFEDTILDNLQFLYQSLKYSETKMPVDVKNVDIDEMTQYVKTKLQATGFHIKMMRVDPTQWTYKSICNKIIELEAQGYHIEILMLDYLLKLPTTGCTVTGPMGTDKRDMIRRIRNFCSSKGIAVVNPLQISTEAKQLIRGGIPEDQFTKELDGKGYYDGCKSLDQEIDVEIYIHLFRFKGISYLSLYRGKLRRPAIVEEEEDKFFLLKFEKGCPLRDDDEDEEQGYTKLPSSSATTSNDALFTMG